MASYEFSTDLIRQVKAVTRSESGLSDYDPTSGDHHHLPPLLPTVSEAVAAFDPSPPYLRCKNCKGRLLRGVQSLLCIYCGRPNDNVLHEPISFADTFAYSWLLQSLHLDGSELVGLTTEKSELTRGQNTPKAEIPLSDFLNLKVSWPTEAQTNEIALKNKTESMRSLNLTGVNLDKYFSGSEMLNSADTPVERSPTSKRVEAAEVKEASSQNNLSFFENVEPSKSAAHSSESKDGVENAAKEVATHDDFKIFQNVQPSELATRTPNEKDGNASSFSGWDASFQSADQLNSSKTFDPFVTSAASGNQHESSKSSDPFHGSTVDQLDISKTLDPFMTSAISSGNQHDSSKSSDNFGGSTVDKIDSSKAFITSAVSSGNQHYGSKLSDPFGGSAVDKLDSSETFDPFVTSGNQHDSSKSSAPFGGSTVDKIDSSMNFDPFMSMTSAVSAENQHDSSKSSDLFGSSTIDLSSQLDSVFGRVEDMKDGSAQTGIAASPSAGDWNDDLWTNLTSQVSQQTGQSYSSFALTDAGPQQSQGSDWFEVDKWQSNHVNAPSSNLTRQDDDSFNDWNDFTTSTGVNVSSSEIPTIKNQNQPIDSLEKTSDVNLFSTAYEYEEMDFGSFSQADPFPSSSSKENVSAEKNDIGLEVSSSDRVVDTQSNISRGPSEPARDGGDTKTAGSQQREEVERILSQMHDLSFMLDNNLSIPPKSNNLHP